MLTKAFEKFRENLELKPTFDSLIQQKHKAVRDVVEKKISGSKTKLIGSVGRKTRIHPREKDDFDIDILVEMGSFTGWVSTGGISPGVAETKLKTAIESSERYGSMNPRADQPVILFEYADGVKVELVPAYRDMIGVSSDGKQHGVVGRGYWVPKNGRWELVDYDLETDYISSQNSVADGYLVPTVKMLKALKREFFPDMSSFYLEVMAALIIPYVVKTAKTNYVPITYHYLVREFISIAPDLFGISIGVPGSNSKEMLLSDQEQVAYRRTYGAIRGHIDAHDGLEADKQLKAWREILGNPFPLNPYE
jgi:predicted nucleotidyltransferase